MLNLTIFLATLYVISVTGQDLECKDGEICQNQDDCETFKTERAKLNQLRKGSSAFKALLSKLRKGVCNTESRKVCCQSDVSGVQSTEDDPDSPSYVPSYVEGECGLSGDAEYIVGKLVYKFCHCQD